MEAFIENVIEFCIYLRTSSIVQYVVDNFDKFLYFLL